MLLYSQSQWEEAGLSDEVGQFVALLWDESFDVESDDFLRPRTCNLRFILGELENIAPVAEEHRSAAANLDHLFKEAKHVAETDPIVRRHFAAVTRGLGWVKAANGKMAELARRSAVLQTELSGYTGIARDDVRQLLREGDAGRKSEIEAALHRLFTALLTHGYSPAYIGGLGKRMLSEPGGPISERFDWVMSKCTGKQRQYDCKYEIRVPRRLTRLEEMLDSDMTLGPEPSRFDGRRPRMVKRSLSVHVDAIDPYQAATKALPLASDLIQSCRLFLGAHGAKLLLHNIDVVASDGEQVTVAHDLLRTRTYVPLERGKSPIYRAPRIINRLASTETEQLRFALRALQVAHDAPSDETKIMSAWSGLEALSRHLDGSPIDRVCGFVPHCAATQLVGRLLGRVKRVARLYLRRLAAEDCSEAEREQATIGLNDFRRSALLRMLCSEDGEDDYQALRDRLSGHPLLRYRLRRLKEHELRGPPEAVRRLRRHVRSVDWQLRRIYRTRNDIVHCGRLDPRLAPLAVHAQEYLRLALVGILDDLSSQADWSVAAAAVGRRRVFDRLILDLERADGWRIPRKALVDVAFLRSGRLHGTPTWGAPAKSSG
jgi:hypothetical protein